MLDELLQVESPDSFQRGAYTASNKALRGKKSLATTDYLPGGPSLNKIVDDI